MIYLDHDIIFVRGVHELWSEFNSFTDANLVGHSPSIINDHREKKKPGRTLLEADHRERRPGRSLLNVDYHAMLKGFNAGVLLLHLDRMRSVSSILQLSFSEVNLPAASIFIHSLISLQVDVFIFLVFTVGNFSAEL